MTIKEFYEQLAPFYHLIYQDWQQSIQRQSAQLHTIIKEYWGDDIHTILDISCGIGTQALGLAQLNYQVVASDLSSAAVERAKQEAQKRKLNISFSVADMRQAFRHHQKQFDLVISCDNAIPHLLTDDDILLAFQQFFKCTQIGGGVIITVRDYEKEVRAGTYLKPERIQLVDGKRHILFQIWDFDGDIYEVSMYVVKDEGDLECTTQVMRGQYYAIGADRLMQLMTQAGYDQVKRLDDVFFQPVLIGTKSQ